MSALLTITRIFVGVLFIFSGLVKANDPLGLSYKMEEYFGVWQWHWLNDYALAFALMMNVFEIIADIAVLLGWRMKLFGWLLLLLVIFFTFLTGYAAFSGKIAACGCFGDCIPLKPIQSFWKDVILLVLILFLLINRRKIKPLVSSKIAMIILIASTIIVSAFQWWVLHHLPVVDCLPYKKGNDLLVQMQTPAGYIPDEYSYVFKYRKDGKIVEFPEDSLPEDIDDSYEFVDREEKLVKKGNDLKAKITDLNFVTLAGNDTTQALLATKGRYILIFSRDLSLFKERYNPIIGDYANKVWKIPYYIVTSDSRLNIAGLDQLYYSDKVLKCDGTVIKTAARTDPTYFVMEGAKVLGKFSYANEDAINKLMK